MSKIDEPTIDRASTAREAGFASRVLDGPLSFGLGLVVLIQLGSWLPHYLTWPYWADHDVFVNAARSWDLGQQPYRDVRQNNFPGTIYAAYLLGKAFGWGRPWTFYAFDSGLLLGLIGLSIAWSRRMFGRALPGLVGPLAFLSYYLGLDYCHAAQRDWQGPGLAVMALLVAQAWPGRAAWATSAVLASTAMAIRPQVVLFLPALLLAVSTGGDPDEPRGRAYRRCLGWLVGFAALSALAFVPLAWNGIFGDFLGSLRRVAFGSSYNRASPASVAKGWFLQASAFRWFVVPSAILLLAQRTAHARTALVWPVAMAGASLYKPISPMAHSYLDLPLVLAWSASLSVLAGLVVASPDASPKIKLASLLALLGMGTTTLRPEFCVVGPNFRAASTLRGGVEPEEPPPGYRHGSVATSAFYPWGDYRAALLYLRSHTSPSTKVANALKGDPAVASEVDRPSAFPAESLSWLRMVDPRDEPAFAESLGRATDSVALWSPGEAGPDPSFQVPRIEAAIRQLYEFEARFGAIEVWRRRPSPASR